MKLKYKFFIVSILLSIFSLAGYFYFSFKTIQADKKAFLIESSTGVQEKFNFVISNVVQKQMLFGQAILNSALNPNLRGGIKDLLEMNKDHFQSFYSEDQKLVYGQIEEKEAFSVTRCANIKSDKKFNFDLIQKNGQYVIVGQFSSNKSRQCLQIESEIAEIHSLAEQFSRLNILIRSAGKVLKLTKSPFSAQVQKQINKMLPSIKESFNEKVQLGGENYFIFNSKISHLNASLILIRPEADLTESFKELFVNLLGIFLMIISLMAFGSLLFSNSLSKPINEVVQTTHEISKGNFDLRIPVKSKDEIGLLAVSVNSMSEELSNYIEEVKEKIRLEQEIGIASTIQDSFFPYNDEIQFENIKLFGKYQSASECGGDWWGLKTFKGQSLVFIGDATGHGTPAAFITAATYTFYLLLQRNPKKYVSENGVFLPSRILEEINFVVKNLGGDFCMTFCVCNIIHSQRKIVCANASHHPPVVLKPDCEKFQQLELIYEKSGARLGEKDHETYEDMVYDCGPGDKVILFTDGIIETSNNSDAMYGESRFYRQLVKLKNSSPKEMVEQVWDKVNTFKQEKPFEDDLTMVVFSID